MHTALGEGRFGPVYQGDDPDARLLVIVRTFARPFTDEQRITLLQALEALCATPLDHPSIARPVACGIERDQPYLVHACLPGVAADQFLRARGPQPLANLLLLLTESAAALDFAAVAGVHHGVLSLSDLIIGAESSGISGLGLVQALRSAGVSADPPTHAGDIAALAAMTVQLILGRSVALPDLRPSLAPLTGVDVDVLHDALASAMSADASTRHASALAFAGALQRAVVSAPVATPVRPPSGVIADVQEDRVHEDAIQEKAVQEKPVLERPVQERPVQEKRLAHADLDRMRDADATPIADLLIRDAGWAQEPEPSADYEAPALFAQAAPHTARSGGKWVAVGALVAVAAALAIAAGYSARRVTPPSAPGQARVETAPQPSTPSAVPPAAPAAPSTPPSASSASSAASGQVFTETTLPPLPSSATPPANSGEQPAAAVERGTTPPAAEPREPAVAERTIERPAEPAATTGGLLVHSEPSGATVVIDGEPRGRTPTVIRALEFGTHSVQISAAGYSPWQRDVALTADRPARSLDVTLDARSTSALGQPSAGGTAAAGPRALPTSGDQAGSLQVDSRPRGAQVFVDGSPVGRTPFLMSAVGAGTHSIRIEASGYRPWMTSIAVSSGERAKIAASLEQ